MLTDLVNHMPCYFQHREVIPRPIFPDFNVFKARNGYQIWMNWYQNDINVGLIHVLNSSLL